MEASSLSINGSLNILGKRKQEDSAMGSKFSSKKRKFTGTLLACKTCGKNHSGECRKITCYKCGKEEHFASRCPQMKCFECGEMGHRKFDCPKSKGARGRNEAANKPRGRAFTMTTDAAKETPDVVSGTFLVDNVPATVLFDSGTSRSFVSVNFCASLDKILSKLDTLFKVETAVGKSVVISKVVKGCHIDLDGHKVPIKLYPMMLGEFDIVLGMDWLAEYYA